MTMTNEWVVCESEMDIYVSEDGAFTGEAACDWSPDVSIEGEVDDAGLASGSASSTFFGADGTTILSGTFSPREINLSWRWELGTEVEVDGQFTWGR